MSFNQILSSMAYAAIFTTLFILIGKMHLPQDAELLLHSKKQKKLKLVINTLTAVTAVSAMLLCAQTVFLIVDLLVAMSEKWLVAWKVVSISSFPLPIIAIIVHLDLKSLRRENNIAKF